MAYVCAQRTPNVKINYIIFDWSISRLVVLNRGWKPEPLQIIIWVFVYSSFSIVKLKTPFETCITRNGVNGVCFISLFIFNNIYGLPVFTMDTKCPNQVFYVSLVDLQTICAKYWLETWHSPNKNIRIYLLDMKHSWTEVAFWDVKSNEWRKWCKFFLPYLINNSYGLHVLTTDINFQIMYFMFDWSIYRVFVPQRGWKRYSK
jgi:hypothetical protein